MRYTTTPTQSWQMIRHYAEKWQSQDIRTGLMTTGYNPPAGAKHKQRVPYHIKYVTLRGEVEQGNVVTLKVNPRRHQRMVQYIDSNEIRWVNDYLVISIDGTRFI